jgi:MFS family permease
VAHPDIDRTAHRFGWYWHGSNYSILVSPIGGVLADVANRRRVMFLTQSVLALLALLLGWLTVRGEISIWYIYALTALQATASAFDLPARQALVPNLVPARDLPSAFSLTSIAFTTGSIIGPALSGLVIAYLGLEYVYYFNAFSFLAVLLALWLMGPVTQQTPTGWTRFELGSIREGIRFILNQPIILSTMLLDFTATFFSSANTLLPIITRDILKAGPVVYGWLSVAQSIGAMAAALILSQIQNLRRQGIIFLGAVVVFGLGTMLLGVSRSVTLAFFALIVIGAADSVSTIIRNTLRQLQTPDYIRGRMVGVNQIFHGRCN